MSLGLKLPLLVASALIERGEGMHFLVASIVALYPGSDPVRLALLGAALLIAARGARRLDALLAAREFRHAQTIKLAIKIEKIPEIRLRPEVRLRRDPRPNIEFPEHVGSD